MKRPARKARKAKTSENKKNLLYFEAATMRDLHSTLKSWQTKNKKRLLSLSIQRDGDLLCCIALTNPAEVMIMDGYSSDGVDVRDNALKIYT